MEFLIVLGSGAFLLGLGVVIWIVVTKRRGQGEANWPRVEGHVESSKVVPFERETPEGMAWSFTPVVHYAYVVGETAYASQQRNVYPDETSTFVEPERAQAVVDTYRPGSSVRVFYNPANPKQAVLEVPKPAAHNAVIFYGVTNMVAGAIIIALGVWLLP
jgi:hypothetical protein